MQVKWHTRQLANEQLKKLCVTIYHNKYTLWMQRKSKASPGQLHPLSFNIERLPVNDALLRMSKTSATCECCIKERNRSHSSLRASGLTLADKTPSNGCWTIVHTAEMIGTSISRTKEGLGSLHAQDA